MDKNSFIAAGIARDLADKNVQLGSKNLGGDFALDSNQDVDEKLATHFYNFLTGKSNQLPTFEFIDYISSLTENKLISANSGVFVYRDLEIVSIDLIREISERRDIITSDNYVVELISSNENGFTSRYIDPEKEPRFQKERVGIVQNLIKQYKKINKSVVTSSKR